MPDASLTWLGHATFRLDTVEGKRIYIDPFFGPTCPENEKDPERVDMILLTHGHGDHLGSTVELWQKHKPRVIAPVELRDWLEGKQGVEGGAGNDANKGGTIDADGIKVTMTDAKHSSSVDDGSYTGEPVGLVVEVENGTKVYFAGDTCVFGDMQLIRRLYSPDIAVLPIGGHYTMDPKEAAVAIEFLGVNRVVPCHYGTFPILKGTPAELKELAPGVEVHDIEPGESITL